MNILPVPFFDNIETIKQLTEKTRSDLSEYLFCDSENRINALREVIYDLDLIKRGSELLMQEIDNND